MRHVLIGLIGLIGLSGCVPAGSGKPQSLDIFVMVGQSQMVGKELLAVPPRFIHEDNIQVFDGETWRPGPLDEHANPGMPFADAMVEATGKPVGLIQCAVGGTTMAQWQPSDDPDSLYGSCLDTVRLAWPAGRVRGVIFWQGESNTASAALALEWEPGFRTFIGGIRADLEDPALPVVFAQIGPSDSPNWPAWKAVQDIQAGFRGESVRMIVTSDLPRIPGDDIHISARGMLTAGQRFAEKMAEMVD